METEKTYTHLSPHWHSHSGGQEKEATAILQETTQGATVRIVSIGTKLGEDTVVVDIQPK